MKIGANVGIHCDGDEKKTKAEMGTRDFSKVKHLYIEHGGEKWTISFEHNEIVVIKDKLRMEVGQYIRRQLNEINTLLDNYDVDMEMLVKKVEILENKLAEKQ